MLPARLSLLASLRNLLSLDVRTLSLCCVVMSLVCLNPLDTIDVYKRHTDLWWFMCVLRTN